jgi:hypothetical protein
VEIEEHGDGEKDGNDLQSKRDCTESVPREKICGDIGDQVKRANAGQESEEPLTVQELPHRGPVDLQDNEMMPSGTTKT